MRLLALLATAGWILSPAQGSPGVTTIIYPNFSSVAGLNLVNSAAVATGYAGQQVLRLTPALIGQGGAAWSTTPISFSSSAGTFSTYFQFQITNPGGISPADGIVFVLQTVSSGSGGAGGSIGYGGITPSVGVEFDTFDNGISPGAFNDPNDNHVGVDIDGSMVSVALATPGGVANCGSPVGVANCMSNGDVWSVWIDYDGTNLVVAAADNSTTRPATNLISYAINIPCVLAGGTAAGTGCPTPATMAYVGFTAGTGSGYENQDIVDWQYTNTYAPIPGGGGPTPTPVPTSLFLAIIGLGVAAAFQARRKLASLLRGGL
ncbi:MAG: L-type lectin-domain containing protein [Bryobacteraceae bacterium]